MHSAIYCGWLSHRRHTPREHSFRYPLFLMYLDLAELDSVFSGRWLWSTRRATLARFDRADHLGDPLVPLDVAVRELVHKRTGRRPAGPIRLLTHLRYFGYCFNPVSFYYCFDESGAALEAIVAEVNNTPWGERHCYVLDRSCRAPDSASTPESAPPGPDGRRTSPAPRPSPTPGRAVTQGATRYARYRTPKAMHVSPFMPMALDYRWGFSVPGERLTVHMALHKEWKVFDATMTLERRPLTGRTLAATLARFPFMTGKVIFGIHWQALKLWLKGIPVETHDPAGREHRAETHA